jgi:DNA-binding NarL/FixJ family response regulator
MTRRRVLVVDDNPGYRLLVRSALRDDPDFEVVAEADSAQAAIAASVRSRPDTALVDVLLAGGDSYGLPDRLREAVPACIVLLTSAHPEGDLDALHQAVGTASLAKSIAPDGLGRQMGTVVDVLQRLREPVERQAVERLPGSLESPRAARRFIEATLDAWDCAEVLDVVKLLTSELVANAIVHAGSEVEVLMRLVGDHLRVDVIDRSTRLLHRRAAADGDQSGRGSELVELLASAWGVSGRPDGKSIWFEVNRPQPVLP